jgi:hypothetical protein
MDIESRPFWIKMHREGLVDVMEDNADFLDSQGSAVPAHAVEKSAEDEARGTDTGK